MEVYKEIFKRKELSESMKTGIIHLIYKKGDKRDIRNWRPITLLCVDYKILSKVLTNRLKEVMGVVVSEDQTCGVRGRTGTYNLSLIRDLISWAEDRDLALGILSLDQEKAFDRVNHKFLFKVLKKMNFGDNFVAWVKVLYNNVCSKVKINGTLGASVKQKGGVRQGCPLSPLLYVLFIEPLAEMLRQEKGIEGVHIPGGGGERAKVAQYADDTTVFFTTDRDLDKIVEVLGLYCEATGSAINVGKSAIMYCGSWRNRKDIRHGFSICNDGLKILGVKFYNRDSAGKNWEEKIERVKKKLGLWKTRWLSITGKGLVVKADVLSGLIYLALVFPVPTKYKLILTRLVFSFIWGGRYEPVKREHMYLEIEEGGRGIVSIPLKLEILFVCFIVKILKEKVRHKAYHFMKLWGAF